MTDKEKTYVYDNIEVVLTGRTAQKEINKTSSRRAPTRKVDVLHEIKPADPENGSWLRWIHKNELYEIKEESKH